MGHSAAQLSVSGSAPDPTSEPRLRSVWLVLARGIWITVAFVALIIFVLSIPAYFDFLHHTCSGMCGYNATQLSPNNVRALAEQHISLATYVTFVLTLDLAVSIVFLGVGGLIFWRRSDDRVALFVSLVLITYGALGPAGSAHSSALLLASPTVSPVPLLWYVLANVFWPAFGFFFYLFPSGRFVPRWSWIFVLAWIVQLISYELPIDSPLYRGNLPPLLSIALPLSTYGTAMGCQVYRYIRVSGPVQRQQTKWFVFGLASGILFTLFANIISFIAFPQEEANPDAVYLLVGVVTAYIFLLPLPLAIAIAVLRYRLWDIDAIINKTLVYGLLTALLGALYAGIIVGLENLLGLFTEQATQPFVIVVATLVIATLFLPLRRSIQRLIDRRFYRRKYDAEKTLVAFSASLRNQMDLGQIHAQVLEVVSETMQPTSVSLWLRQPPATSQDVDERRMRV